MINSVIIWQQDWSKIKGFVIKSPISGQVLPLHMHPEPLYSQNILPFSVCCKLDDGMIYAPFNCTLTTNRDTERRLIFTHKSGLKLIIDLPILIRNEHGKGIHWLNRPSSKLEAGTAVLQLDLPYLQLTQTDMYCVITLIVSSGLDTLYSRKAMVTASVDPLFVLQFDEK